MAVPAPSSRKVRQRLQLLAIFLVLIAVARLRTYDEPLERDIAIYSLIGQEMLKGRALYADLWDLKPPGVYLAYALAHAVTPTPRAAVYLLGVSMSFLTLLGIVRLVERFQPGWIWMWAALCWVLISNSLSLQANQPNAEVFLNAGVVWFLVFCTRDAKAKPGSRWQRMVTPAVLAVTSLVKQVAIVLGLCMAIAFTVTASSQEKRWAVIGEWTRIAAFGALFWILVLLFFAFNGTYEAFYQAVFEFGSEYTGSWSENLKKSFSSEQRFPGFVTFVWPLTILTLAGIVIGISKPATRQFSVVLLALCAATWVEVALPGKFFSHYYQLWLPVVVIGSSWGVAMIPRKAAVAVAGIAFALLLRSELPAFSKPAEQWSREKYGEEFILDQHMGADLGTLLEPGETFYHWGNQPSLYFETRISPPTGVFFGLMLWSPVIGDPLAARILSDLKTRLPDLYVESVDWAYPPACQAIMQWRQANYRRLDGKLHHGRFALYARLGSPLGQRYGVR